LSDSERNRAFWDRESDSYQETHREHIGRPEPRWGLWQLPESELGILGDVAGMDVLELGCGAAQWSILLAAQGARPVGVDNSERQLEHARLALAAAGLEFPLVHAPAESVPLPDASFDVVFADHGANRFADPYEWVPEAARLLRPGALLAFSGSTPLEVMCWNESADRMDAELHRDYFGLHRIEEADGPVQFELPYGEWIRLFRANELDVEDMRGDSSAFGRRVHLPLGRGHRVGAELADGADVDRPQGSMSHVERNRTVWTEFAPEFAEWAPRAWASDDFTWGVWNVSEAELRALPEVAGMDTIELGCGTGYISAWLARRGARPVGVDITPAQLETARRMQSEFGLDFPLLEASAEDVPLPDASFDLAISEYGASIWADPYRWVPEAARLLRPGGRLVFLVNGTVMILCSPDVEAPPGRELLRPYFGLHRFVWDGTGGVEFHLGYGDWIRLLRANGFTVENLIEIQAPAEGEPHRYEGLPDRDWARRWPSEEIWVACKRP